MTNADRASVTAAKWVKSLIEGTGESGFLGTETAPFSFLYGGKSSADFLSGWERSSDKAATDENRTLHKAAFTDPETGLKIETELTEFHDFPAVEWILYFTNTGTANTPIISDILPLDTVVRSEKDPILHHAKGAVCSMDDYKPLRRVLNKKAKERFTAGGGRSSSDYLPFFNVETTTGEGMIFSVGWSGEWAVGFERDSAENLNITAGMDLTHLTLYPGERIRTPRMLALFWEGDRTASQNALRQFILKYHRHQSTELPVFVCTWGGTPANEHLQSIQWIVEHDLPVEYYWIDAEWFGTGQYRDNTGNWNHKKDLFPDGFKPISDAVRKSGRKFLLWFEPERVSPGTPWHTEISQWLLTCPAEKEHHCWGLSQADPRWVQWESARNQIATGDRLFNLAIPEARQFLTDFISAKIEEYGIDCYRHDANIGPLEFWRAADSSDRQGMTEIRWVEGLYEFWGGLLKRHPGLMIDNCASGGRRIDLETLSLSTPFWRTDYPNPLAKECHAFGMLSWIPLNATGAINPSKDSEYDFRCTMSSSVVIDLFPTKSHRLLPLPEDYPWEKVRGILERYKEIRKYYLGDYYPLTEYSQAADAWLAYQLALPEESEGAVVVLKRGLSRLTTGSFPLKAIDADADYQLRRIGETETLVVSGKDLANGLDVVLKESPASVVVVYKRIG